MASVGTVALNRHGVSGWMLCGAMVLAGATPVTTAPSASETLSPQS